MEQVKVISDVILEVLAVIGGAFVKFFMLFLWGISGIFILFCVFIANTFYPKWEKWAESLKK